MIKMIKTTRVSPSPLFCILFILLFSTSSNPGYSFRGSWVDASTSRNVATHHRPDFKGKWPRSNRVDINGDVIIGALMPIHTRPENDSLICGEVSTQEQLQILEAFLLALDVVNRNEYILPNIKLGAKVLDNCHTDSYALKQAEKFAIGDGNETPIAAVMDGTSSSDVVSLFNLLKIPHVSYSVRRPDLANPERLPFHFRTAPSQKDEVMAMVDLVRNFNWTYISVVYEDSNYGQQAVILLEKMLGTLNICIAARGTLPEDSKGMHQSYYTELALKLRNVWKSRGVIVYGSDGAVGGFFRAVANLQMEHWFSFVGGGGWGGTSMVYQDKYESVLLGAIAIQPTENKITGFNEYFVALTPDNNPRNPWFYEFWEKEFQCRYAPIVGNSGNSEYFPDTPYNAYPVQCNESKNLGYAYQNDPNLRFVSDSVLVLALGLQHYLLRECPSLEDACVMRHTARINRTLLRERIEEVEFSDVGLDKQPSKFTHNALPSRFDIVNFRQIVATGRPTWFVVGNYTEQGLQIRRKQIQFYSNDLAPGGMPKSSCADPCAPDHRTIGQSCCWICAPCPARHVIFNRTTCVERTQLFSLEPYWLFTMALALIGCFILLFIWVVFLRRNSTPIIAVSGRNLSYVVMIGLFICFCLTPIGLLTPSVSACAIYRILSGFPFTLVYAAILTKMYIIAKKFRNGTTTLASVSVVSQLIICSSITSVQVIILGVWLFVVPPKDVIYETASGDLQYVCSVSVSNSFIIAYAYPVLLCVLSAFYTIHTWKIPTAFNESKFISATVFGTLIIWAVFLPVYFTFKESLLVRTVSVSISASLFAMACQVFLFLPKVYIVLFRSERNVSPNLADDGSLDPIGKVAPVGLQENVQLSTSDVADHREDNIDAVETVQKSDL